ncbi:MAG: TRL-like family protein [Treponema sp.]|nr:TRL-like family protein [Treponema sp.]
MKKLMIVFAIVFAVAVFSGCASRTTMVNWFTTGDVIMELRGEATNIVWFGVFGEQNYPSVEQVARDNGITRIATVERFWRLGTFGLWIEYTTIVTGQ